KGLENEEEENDSGPERKILKHNPCIACLGVLQKEYSNDNAVQKIVSDVLRASYDCNIFTCALSLPISFQLRSHSLWLHLVDKFPVHFGLEIQHESHVVSIKEAWKWTIAPVIAKAINKELDSGVKSDFFVGINVVYSGDEEECSCLLEMHEDVFKIRKTQKRKYHGNLYTRKAVELALQTTDAAHFKKFFPSPPPVPAASVTYDNVTCSHNSMFMAGRYNKFSRTLSQTPWVIDGERRMESSVQEIICESLQITSKAEGIKFSASGREDVDVRTMGRGRPFVCELLNPHRVKFTVDQVLSLEADINSSSKEVAVRDLQIVPKDELTNLKAGEEKKVKCYVALCVCHDHLTPGSLEKLANIKDLTLSQKTPIRVLHRRPLANRPRIIHSMRAWLLENSSKLCKKGKYFLYTLFIKVSEDIMNIYFSIVYVQLYILRTKNAFLFAENATFFKLELKSQAGTYIKEFVHGDFGRTQPSLGQLLGGVSVDILALDVEVQYCFLGIASPLQLSIP
ncbi:hypothetical protein ANN_06523, partial [Periplaneta americana]